MKASKQAVAVSGEQIEITCGDQRAVVVEVGGGLRLYGAEGRELLDGYGLDERARSGRGQVLVPWPNRIQDGRYVFERQRHQLALTEPERGNAIHGLVRWATWTVGEREPDRVVMEHVIQAQPGYPFILGLAVEYALSEGGLSVRTTATNLGADACPYGCGHHPYLTLGTTTVDSIELRAPASSVLVADARGIPGGAETVAGTEFDFRRRRALGATKLDHAFGDLARGQGGRAHVDLEDPETGRGVTLWLDEGYRYLMLFTGDTRKDVNRRSLAVEPMTCPPNAFRSGADLVRLEPGESLTTAWGITPR